jgi:putative transposase
MEIYRAYKTELDLTNAQKTACFQHAGIARFAYNWGLSRKLEAYQLGQKTPTAIDLHNELIALKKTEFRWMREVSKCAPQEALRDLDNAFRRFFRRVKERKAGKNVKVGFPKFKKKNRSPAHFRLTGTIKVFRKSIQLPRLGILRLKEDGYIPESDIHILSATISEKVGRWYVAFQVRMEIPDQRPSNKPVAGVDLGIHRMAQVSDGIYFENPRSWKQSTRKLKRLQRDVSRRQMGSANRQKALLKLAKAHKHVANIRKESIHQATTWLAKSKSIIMLEKLNITGMLKNKRLAQSISDVGWHEFQRQLTYKGKWYGCDVRMAAPFYPSTKRCSQCGQIRESVLLHERVYRCHSCGFEIDRDLNAAINLEQLIYMT